MWRYAKFWVALLGAAVIIVNQFDLGLGTKVQTIGNGVLAVLTAAGVWATPNADA